ncbi:hypothetical protein FMH13_00085 [Vibrio cholerae]|nr:hypothetical protein [Vibrio cholerae]
MWLYCYGLPRILLAEIYIPFLLETAVVLATFIPPQSHSLSMLVGIRSLAAYLQLQGVLVYIISATTYLLKYHLYF